MTGRAASPGGPEVLVAETAGDRLAVRDLIVSVWGEREAEYYDHRVRHPRDRADLTRFIREGDGVVAVMTFRHERRRLGTALIDCAYMEHTCVRESHRGRGLLRALMADAVQALRDNGLPLILTHGPAGLYRRFGFAPYRYLVQVTLPVERATSMPAGCTSRLASVDDAEDLAALSARAFAGEALTEVRTPEIWRFEMETEPDILVVQDRLSRVSGYAWVDQRAVRRKYRIIEAAAADRTAALCLCAALAERARAAGCEMLYFALAPWNDFGRIVIGQGGEGTVASPVQPSRFGHMDMALVADGAGLLAWMRPELERRLAASTYAHWSGEIAIDWGSGRAMMVVDSGRVSAAPSQRYASLEVRLPPESLAPLLAGCASARDLAGLPGLHVPENLTTLLDSLFPPLWPGGENEDWWIED